jgi:ABC-type nitrate/sulfonate/bicarbonate transport system substrate-binding protein
MSLETIRKRAMQNKRLQEYLKEAGLSFNEVSIKELTSKGWRVLQKGVSEAVILIMSGKIQLVLPL